MGKIGATSGGSRLREAEGRWRCGLPACSAVGSDRVGQRITVGAFAESSRRLPPPAAVGA